MTRDLVNSARRALAPLVIALCAAFVAAPAVAQVPDLMPYQGYITDDAGAPYQGEVSLTFRMYADGDSPGPAWTEQWDAVPVEDGVFYVYLGMFSPVADALASGNARYLGVAIGGEGEATPRQRVGSVPFALMARDARTLEGYAAEDFATRGDLGSYARWDQLGERGYITGLALDERGYATEEWVRGYVGEQAYLTAEDIEDIEVDLTGYATEQWVRDQGYLTADDVNVDLEGYATEDWVRGYVGEQGYLRADALDGYASEEWVMTYVGEQGYLRADALEGYASEQWVRDQGYTTEDWVRGYVGDQEHLTAAEVEAYGYVSEAWVMQYVADQDYLAGDALAGYATEQWVRDQGYLAGDALAGYATEQWVRDQGYLTTVDLDARGYFTVADLENRNYITFADVEARGYVTAADIDDYATQQWVVDQGYITGAALDARGYITGAALDARDYATRAYVDTLRADVSRTYVTIAGLEARGFITAAALDDYATTDALGALEDRIDALQAQLAQVAAASSGFLLGRSNQSSTGRFSFNGETGIQAANEMCRSTYPNEPTAHFCSPDEVFRAISTGAYNAAIANTIDGVWTWAVTQTAVTARGNNSLAGNCQNLMYNSGDASSGTRLRVDLDYRSNGNGGGLTGDVVQIQQEIGCGTDLPVLCCR